MAEKPPEQKPGLPELLKTWWAPLAAFVGAISLAYNFYKLWLGDQVTVTYFLAGGGLIVVVIALGWVGFSTKTTTRKILLDWTKLNETETNPRFPLPYRRAAWGGLGVLSLLAVAGILLLIQHRQAQEKYLAEQQRKLIAVIAGFEGPEEVYGLRNQIIENLNATFSTDKNIQIIPLNETITLAQGSPIARQLGQQYLADVVIWGWYRPTENPNITIHIENLSPAQLLPLKDSQTLTPVATLADLQSFSFQQEAGQETSSLISFLAGFIDFNNGNYQLAILGFDKALANLSTAPRLVDNRAEIYFYRANAYNKLGEPQRAIQDYDQAIQIDPKLAHAHNNRGFAYIGLGDYQHAIQDCDQAIQLDPKDTEAYNNRGIAYINMGQFQRAIQDFDQAIQINPQDTAAYNSRGVTYVYLGQYQRAIQDFEQAIQVNPQFAAAYNSRGFAYADLGQYQRAIQDYDQAIRIDPQYVVAFNNRGHIYDKLGQYQRAIQDYDQVIQMNPQYPDAYSNRGAAYYKLGQYQRAIKDFDQAIQIDPKNANAYNNRGFAYTSLGQYQRAIQDYDHAIQIDPQLTAAYNNRGLAYVYLGQDQRAIQDYDQVIRIDPKAALTYRNRGLAYQRLGNTILAAADFAKYKELTGKDAP